MVLGLQGKAQLETLYGHMAEAMLSQPGTKIFLKTSEPNAAEWISDAIGEQEIERFRESRTQRDALGTAGRATRGHTWSRRKHAAGDGRRDQRPARCTGI